MDAATVRTTTRTFGRDADGVKTLVEVIEEEKHTLAGGDSNVVRATSDPDANGNLQLVQRPVGKKNIFDEQPQSPTQLHDRLELGPAGWRCHARPGPAAIPRRRLRLKLWHR